MSRVREPCRLRSILCCGVRSGSEHKKTQEGGSLSTEAARSAPGWSQPSHPRQSSVYRFSIELFGLEPFHRLGQGRGPPGPPYVVRVLFVMRVENYFQKFLVSRRAPHVLGWAVAFPG